MVADLQLETLIAIAAGAGFGAVSSVTCWSHQSLPQRHIRRPLASVCVYSSLGLVFGCGASLAAEIWLRWGPLSTALAGLVAGAAVGMVGPVNALRLALAELLIYLDFRRSRPSDGRDTRRSAERRAESQDD